MRRKVSKVIDAQTLIDALYVEVKDPLSPPAYKQAMRDAIRFVHQMAGADGYRLCPHIGTEGECPK